MLNTVFRSSIINKTAFYVATVFLVSTFILIFVIAGFSSYWIKKQILSDKQEFITEISRSIDEQFKNLSTPLISLGNQSSVRTLIRYQGDYDKEWLSNIRDIDASFSKMHIYYERIVDVVIISAESEILYSLTRRLNHNYDFVNSDWFNKAMEQPTAVKYAPPHGSEHYYSQQEYTENSFSVFYPVTGKKGIEGYILCEINVTKMSSLFQQSQSGEQNGYIMLDENGNTIYDYMKNRRSGELLEIWNTLCQAAADEAPMQITRNSRLYIGKRLDTTGWYMISEYPTTVIKASANTILFSSVFISACAIFLSILVLRRITRKLQQPIDSLVERISSYDGTGAVSFDKAAEGFQEITTIRSKFEEMAAKMNSLINDVYVAQIHQKDIELEMLVSQINPHFLYNVLQTIHGQAVLHGDHEIEDMITALGEILRYTTDHTQEMTTIERELLHVKNYLGFYKKRFPELFTYTIDSPEELSGLPVLKYLLQPVVENSIIHGFENKKSGGELRISVTKEDNCLRFELYDNGRGISEAHLKQIRKDMYLALRNPGVGVANTDARIKLKYVNQYGIELESIEHNYTRIIITTPV